MTDDEYSVTDEVVELNERFQQNASYGGVSLAGLAGYHSLWNHDSGIEQAGQTAIHAALDEVLMEVSLDPQIVEQNHGEVTPETMADELREQLKSFTQMGPLFANKMADSVEDKLSGYQSDIGDSTEKSNDE